MDLFEQIRISGKLPLNLNNGSRWGGGGKKKEGEFFPSGLADSYAREIDESVHRRHRFDGQSRDDAPNARDDDDDDDAT